MMKIIDFSKKNGKKTLLNFLDKRRSGFRVDTSVVDKIIASLKKSCFNSFLLHGVTGSGKTEIYIGAVQHCLKQNRNAIDTDAATASAAEPVPFALRCSARAEAMLACAYTCLSSLRGGKRPHKVAWRDA